MAAYAVLLLWPLIGVVRASVQSGGQPLFTEYARFFSSPLFRAVLWRTMSLSLLATAVTVVLSFPVAVYLAQPGRRGRTIVTFAIIAPMLVSAVARSYGWIIILGLEGLVSRIGVFLGLGDSSGHLLYTELGVIIALVHLQLPLMVLPIAGSLQQIDPALDRAASILGAGWLRIFLKVTLPLAAPGMTAGAVIVFCMSASSFVTPALIGGPTIPMMSFVIYQQAVQLIDWPFASAASVILLLATASVTLAYLFWAGRGARRRTRRTA